MNQTAAKQDPYGIQEHDGMTCPACGAKGTYEDGPTVATSDTDSRYGYDGQHAVELDFSGPRLMVHVPCVCEDCGHAFDLHAEVKSAQVYFKG